MEGFNGIPMEIFHLLYSLLCHSPSFVFLSESRGPPLFLLKILDDCSESLHSLLEDSEIDRHTIVRPEDTGYHHTLAYLLSWQLIVNFFTSAPAQVLILYSLQEPIRLQYHI